MNPTGPVPFVYSDSGLPDQPECPICLEPFDQKRAVTTINCSHQLHNDCLTKWKKSAVDIAIANRVANPVPTCPMCRAEIANTGSTGRDLNGQGTSPGRNSDTLMSPGRAINDRNFPLARLLVGQQGRFLTGDELRTALERAAASFNARQARSLLELSASDGPSQATARSILEHVLQTELLNIDEMSWDYYVRLDLFIGAFFQHGIRDTALVNMAVKLSVLKGDLGRASQFVSEYGASLDATTFRTALQKVVQTMDHRKAKTLLKMAASDPDLQQAVAISTLSDVLQTALQDIHEMYWDDYAQLNWFIDVFFDQGIRDTALANMAVKLSVLKGDLDGASQFASEYGASLDATTFRTALQKVVQTMDRRKAKTLLKMAASDPDLQQAVAISTLSDVLQTALPNIHEMRCDHYARLNDFIDVFFLQGIHDAALVNMAVRLFVLRGDLQRAEQLRSQFSESEYAEITVASPDNNDHEKHQSLFIEDAAWFRKQLLKAIKNNQSAQVVELMNQAKNSDAITETELNGILQEGMNSTLDCDNQEITAALLEYAG